VTVADAWGQPLSTTPEAAEHWRDHLALAAHRRSGHLAALRAAVRVDPTFAMARAALAVEATFEVVDGVEPSTEVEAALAGAARHNHERSYVDATRCLVRDGLWASLPRWLDHHDRFPRDLAGMEIALFLLTFSTGVDARPEVERRARMTLSLVGEDAALVGFLGMAAQERGDLDEAHRLATRSLELDPTSFAGGHPMAHVFFESGDHAAGAQWLDEWLPTTDQDAEFGGHLVWHSGLHHLAQGNADVVLERYAACGGSLLGGRLIDGPSLLWRMQLHGLVPRGTDPVDPPVSALARPLMDGVPFAFVGAHAALALATAGDADGLRALAHAARGFDAPGAAELLPDLALGLAAYVEGDHGRASDRLLALEPGWPRIGGSHAQREVFDDTLLQALVLAGRHDEAVPRLQRRLDRRESRLDAGLLARARGVQG